MSALVSVVVPVYNLEKYIENCLKSIVAQTYKNLEILCIDDGSTDGSADIIKSMAENDLRIKYVYQENAGVSAARNRGMNEATGEYLMFVDGDDYLHYQAVELLHKSLVKVGADIVCSHFKITESLSEEMPYVEPPEPERSSHEMLFTEKYNSISGKSACSKLYKTDIARLESFPVGITNGEDGYYFILLLNHNPKVFSIDCQLYYYYTRPNSTVTSRFTIKRFTTTYSFDMLCEKLKDSPNLFLKKYCLQYLFQSIFYNRTQAIGTSCEKEVISESKRIGKKWLKDFQRNNDISPIIKISFTVFFYSRHIYELARAIQDPTMIDFYKSRKKENIRNES